MCDILYVEILHIPHESYTVIIVLFSRKDETIDCMSYDHYFKVGISHGTVLERCLEQFILSLKSSPWFNHAWYEVMTLVPFQ